MPSYISTISPPSVNFLNYFTAYYQEKVFRAYKSKDNLYIPLAKEMTTALIEKRLPTLNFKDCDKNIVAELKLNAPELVQMIGNSNVAEVRLPIGMTQIPEWLTDLRNIRSLEISTNTEETELNLKELNSRVISEVEIKVTGRNLSAVHAPVGIQIRSASEGINLKQKVTVTYYNKEGKEVRTATLPGNSYLACGHNKTMASKLRIGTNYNNQIFFPSTEEKIQCRHLSLFWLYQKKETGQNLVDRIEEKLHPMDRIAKNVPPELEERYNEVIRHGKKNYLVSHLQWGAFLQNQFENMKVGKTKKIIVESGNHLMALQLKVKNGTEHSSREFIAEFYDPNMTITHLRKVESDLEKVKAWNLSEFLFLDEQIDTYFGKINTLLREEAISLTELPENISESTTNNKLWSEDNTDREVTFFLGSEEDNFPPVCVHHLMRKGFGQYLPDIIKTAKKNEVFNLLAAKNSKGNGGLFFALTMGHTSTVKEFISILEEQHTHGTLTREQVVELLTANFSNGRLGVINAHEQGYKDTVKEFIDGVTNLTKRNVLSEEQAKQLFQ